MAKDVGLTERLMTQPRACAKCGASRLIRATGAIDPSASVFTHRGEYVRFGLFGAVAITRFLCGTCGYCEEWIESPADLAKLRAAAGIDDAAAQQGHAAGRPKAAGG